MEELCHSIGRQNATILTGSSADFAPFLASEPLSSQQPHTERAKDQENTTDTQNSADSGEESVEANDHQENAKGEHDGVEKSFAEALHAYIPEDSVLMRSIKNRKPDATFISERYPVGCHVNDLEDGALRELLVESELYNGGALIIQDVNRDWAEILRSEFPESVYTTFLAEHMIRLDAASTTDVALEQLEKDISSGCPDTKMEVTRSEDGRLVVDFRSPYRTPKDKGLHIDFLFETMRMERVSTEFSFSGGTRRMIYEKDLSNHWRRASHRMSWCQLGERFYLALVDTSPGFDQELSSTAMKESPYQILLDPRIDASKFWTQSRLPIQYAPWNGPNDCLKSMIAQVLQHHTVQSVFAPVAVPINESDRNLRPQRYGLEKSFTGRTRTSDDRAYQRSPIWGNRQMILWLLTESSWQLAISTLEVKWQRVRCRVTKWSGDDAFVQLRGLRRQVADAQDLIAESKEAFTHTMKETTRWIVNGNIVSADEFWSGRPSAPTTAIFRHAQSMDIRNLPDSFEKMEERVSAMTRAINQEIQVVIGSVQVEDAKTMKRQTEWMVALALLAAIYLPMTLVTGIFGMNISEINADETLPSRWVALKAWAVVFGATLGCLMMYAMARRPIKWLLEQREIAKVEAMHVEAQKIK